MLTIKATPISTLVERDFTEMKKFIVTATYIDQYQLDFDPRLETEWWIRGGTLYISRDTQSEPWEVFPVVEFDSNCPNKVEVQYDDALFDDDE